MSDHQHHHLRWPFHLHKPHPGLSRRLHLPHGVQPVFETYTFSLHGRDYHCSFHPCYGDDRARARYCGRLLPEMLGAHHVDVEVFGQDVQGARAREAGLSFARRVLRRCVGGGGGAPQVKGRIEVVDSALTAVDEVDYKFCVCSQKVRKEDAVLVLDVPHAKNEVVRTFPAPEPGCACADRHSTSGNDKNGSDNNNRIQGRNGSDHHHHYVKQQQQQHQDNHHRNGNKDGHRRKDNNDNDKDNDSDCDNDLYSESLPPVVAEFLWKASKLEPSTEVTRLTAVVIDEVYYLTSAELCKYDGDVSSDGRLTPSAPFAEAEFLDLCNSCLRGQAFAGIPEAFRSELLPTDFCPSYDNVMIPNESRAQYGCRSHCSALPDFFADVMNGNNYVTVSEDFWVSSRDSATIDVCDPPPSYSETDPFPWNSYSFFKDTDSRHCSRKQIHGQRECNE